MLNRERKGCRENDLYRRNNIHKVYEVRASMAHSKAAWLTEEDEEEMSLERKEAGDSIILSFLSPQGFYFFL